MKENYKTRAILFFTLLLNIGNILAQDNTDGTLEAIITDRPDQTEAPTLTPVGFIQIEIGAQTEFDKNKENREESQNTLFNTTLWKYGVSKNIELRLITEYAGEKIKYNAFDNSTKTTSLYSGFNPISVGTKIAIQKEHGIIPDISLISHLELPYFGAERYKPKNIIPRFRFLFAHTLNDRFTFSYNLGAEWESESTATTGIYTASLGISLIKNLSMFVEGYGFLRENTAPDHRLDGGFTYVIKNNVQLDCSGGIGLTENAPDYFVSAGLSFRFAPFFKKDKKSTASLSRNTRKYEYFMLH